MIKKWLVCGMSQSEDDKSRNFTTTICNKTLLAVQKMSDDTQGELR
jgi:hypothetical protein